MAAASGFFFPSRSSLKMYEIHNVNLFREIFRGRPLIRQVEISEIKVTLIKY